MSRRQNGQIKSIPCISCGNFIWSKWEMDGFLICTNCFHERKYTERKAKTNLSPSQRLAVDIITKFLSRNGEAPKVELNHVVNGIYQVIAASAGNVYTRHSITCFLGRRGGISKLIIDSLYKPYTNEATTLLLRRKIKDAKLGVKRV